MKGKTGIGIWTVLDDVSLGAIKRYPEDMHEAYKAQKIDEAIWIAQKIRNLF